MSYSDYTVGSPVADQAAPTGPIETRWERRRFGVKLVNPANKRSRHIIVVGTGLAGASAGASLGELGYRVSSFCYQDSPRRAHSIAAQGGINAAKNYRNDGDSVHRLFYDTVKGGDFRARESNVHRLAEISRQIIDQCVAQGVPFAREYGGLLELRSFGGVQVSRTFYARGQTGQQLLIGAYQALERQIDAGTVLMYPRHEMLELVTVAGRARGIAARDLVTGEITTHLADAVVLATGGYGNVFHLSTNAKGCNVTASWRAHRKGALFANPCFTQIHPTCIPVSGQHQSKLTLMSESLRNDGRVWVPRRPGDDRAPGDIPPGERGPILRGGQLHRLRSLRGRLPERFRLAVPRRQDHSPRPAAAGPTGALPAGPADACRARRERLRRMYQHRSVHHRLPEGDTTGCDRTAEPRLPGRHAAWPGRALNTGRQAPGGRRAGPAEGACPAAAERTFDLRHTWSLVCVTPVSTWAVDAALSQLTCDARRTLRDTRTTCTRRRVWR
jgi:hypothetical protein